MSHYSLTKQPWKLQWRRVREGKLKDRWEVPQSHKEIRQNSLSRWQFFFTKTEKEHLEIKQCLISKEIRGCLCSCGQGAMAKWLSPTCPFRSHLRLISLVLCLHTSCGQGRWRGENYAQWDTWRIQFEIEMSMNHSACYLSRNGPQTHSVLLFLRKR